MYFTKKREIILFYQIQDPNTIARSIYKTITVTELKELEFLVFPTLF